MSTVDAGQQGPIVVGIGEALFDCLPTGLVLGGAPVNFAVHINQLLQPVGGKGMLVSRIGDDELGTRIINELDSRDVSTNFIQTDPHHATGQVDVELSAEGQPTYTIAENVAWDHIAYEDSLEQLASTCDAVCFGTLGQRNEISRDAIQKFLSSAKDSLRVLDVNLRQHYFTAEVLLQSCELANVVKINDEEIERVSELLSEVLPARSNRDDRVQDFIKVFDLELLALTRGKDGTALYSRDARCEGEKVEMKRLPDADSVGAGDACCAGIVFGLLRKWPLQRIADLANNIGAFVASQSGATPRLPTALIESTVA